MGVVARQHYRADRMCLAVLGGEPLDVLQQWVVDLFSAVPSGGGPRPAFSQAGFPYEVPAYPRTLQPFKHTLQYQTGDCRKRYIAG
jgi:secreted Zn-dependent insulinase-like peptidase